MKKNHKSKGQKMNLWAAPRLPKASRVLWVDSIHPQLSIKFKNSQFRGAKTIWPFEVENGDFPRHNM